jgi:lipopolysaccharide biosynthesis glycosyltransferase
MDRIIYTAADGNYGTQAQVLLKSLAKTQREKTHLIIFGNDWSAKDQERIASLASDVVSAEIREVPDDKFHDVKLKNGFPLATAYNILAPEYLLPDEGRVVYMDADMVVTEDLDHFWEMDMENPVAAVIDAHVYCIGSPSMWRPWREENLDPSTPYLNTGLMVIDGPRWREAQITQRTLEFLRRYELPCVDQDAINLVLKGDFDHLEPRYNSMPYHLLSLFRYADIAERFEDVDAAITRPAIIHFHRSFLGKPWTVGATHPATQVWRSLAREVNPKWRPSIDVRNYVRNTAAKFAGMAKVDERSVEMARVSVGSKKM